MDLKFTPPQTQPPGTLAEILKMCYSRLVASNPLLWNPEVKDWERFDFDVYRNPNTVGDCTFLTWWDKQIIGFASFDPRPRPVYGLIGHNCVLPEFQNHGVGKAQIYGVLRRLNLREIQSARVSTLDHPFFQPARRMYLACGFKVADRQPWPASPDFVLIHFEKKVGDSK